MTLGLLRASEVFKGFVDRFVDLGLVLRKDVLRDVGGAEKRKEKGECENSFHDVRQVRPPWHRFVQIAPVSSDERSIFGFPT